MAYSREREGADDQTYALIGIALLVHKELGKGFLEHVYQEAMKEELLSRHIPFSAELPLPVLYRGRKIAEFRADLVCWGEILLELKALAEIGGAEIAQTLNYLKASGLKRALLINFGGDRLKYKRVVYSGG